MSLLERFEACKGLDTAGIAAQLADLEQDDITVELMRLFGARTVRSALPLVPFVIQHTMYGDLDVSDWLLRYSDSGFDAVPAPTDAQPDAKIRWEHWEDAVRLVNGDAGEAGLFFTRRIETVGDDTAAKRWMGAVDFTGSGDLEERPGVLVMGLRAAAMAGEKELASYIEEKGLPRLLRARAMNMASSVAEIGAADLLAGSFMRLEISTQPRVGVETDFPNTGGRAETRILAPEELGNEDFNRGVTLRFESVEDFVDAVTFRVEMPQQITSGRLRVFGSAERIRAFGEAMNMLANALRPTGL